MKLLAKLVLAATLILGTQSAVAQHRGQFRGPQAHIIQPARSGVVRDERGFYDYRHGYGFYGYRGWVAPYVYFPYNTYWTTYGCTEYDYYSGMCLPYNSFYGPSASVGIGIGIHIR